MKNGPRQTGTDMDSLAFADEEDFDDDDFEKSYVEDVPLLAMDQNDLKVYGGKKERYERSSWASQYRCTGRLNKRWKGP